MEERREKERKQTVVGGVGCVDGGGGAVCVVLDALRIRSACLDEVAHLQSIAGKPGAGEEPGEEKSENTLKEMWEERKEEEYRKKKRFRGKLD